MKAVDTDSAIPRYHQIAEAIRYDIATGVIRPGTKLPTLKAGARRWAVNLHTVRRAYRELAKRGIVETRTPGGTRVLGPGAGTNPPGKSPAALRRFIAETTRKAQEKFGLSPERLAALLTGAGRPEMPADDTVTVVECSETQSKDLATQVQRRWHLRAVPWSLTRSGEPPAGTILATYFHYNEVRVRWPHRRTDIRFVAIHPDPALSASLAAFRGSAKRSRVVLCEREQSMADSIAADLRVLLPPREFRLETNVTTTPEAILDSTRKDTIVVFSPRVWGELDAAQRADPRVFEVRYVFEEDEILAVAADLGWRPCDQPQASVAPRSR